MVRCPSCQNKFQPVPEVEMVAVAPIRTPTKECPYCGEQVLVAAKKCRHCGEIIDVALRAAEEAKQASHRQVNPFVVNNNVSTSASAAAAASAGGPWRRHVPFRWFLGLCGLLVAIGIYKSINGQPDAGALASSIGLLGLIVGIPLSLIIEVVRFFSR